MKIYAVSDVHIDYETNRKWISNLSSMDYIEDVLLLCGDISDELELLEWCFKELTKKFFSVLFVPGNHELWVVRNKFLTSIEKYHQICKLADNHGVLMKPFHWQHLSIIPMQSWYDFSFASPSARLLDSWTDFQACIWPNQMQPIDVTEYFLAQNFPHLTIENDVVITFSHFLPRIDLMPSYIPEKYRYLYPVLGSNLLEQQIRRLNPDIHVYGHSHVNRQVELGGIKYINNAFGYPSEYGISSKNLLCIYES